MTDQTIYQRIMAEEARIAEIDRLFSEEGKRNSRRLRSERSRRYSKLYDLKQQAGLA